MSIVPVNRLRRPPEPSGTPDPIPVAAPMAAPDDAPKRRFVRRLVTRPAAAPAAVDTPQAEAAAPPRKVGRGHPPVEHQFRKGGKPGPGRPKGSKNHDTKLKERFETKRVVRIGGVEQVASQHDILIDLRFKSALEGKEKAQQSLLDEARRLYPADDESGPASGTMKPLTRAEQALLDQIFADAGLVPMVAAVLPDLAGSGSTDEPDYADDYDDRYEAEERL